LLSVIVAVLVSGKESAAFKGSRNVADAWPGAKFKVPDVAW